MWCTYWLSYFSPGATSRRVCARRGFGGCRCFMVSNYDETDAVAVVVHPPHSAACPRTARSSKIWRVVGPGRTASSRYKTVNNRCGLDRGSRVTLCCVLVWCSSWPDFRLRVDGAVRRNHSAGDCRWSSLNNVVTGLFWHRDVTTDPVLIFSHPISFCQSSLRWV